MARRGLMMSARKRQEIRKRKESELEKLRKEHAEALNTSLSGKRRVHVERESVSGNYKPTPLTGRAAERSNIPSLSTTACSTAKIETPKYTGTRLLGITVLHKSCLQPVFSQDEAVDAAHMRR